MAPNAAAFAVTLGFKLRLRLRLRVRLRLGLAMPASEVAARWEWSEINRCERSNLNPTRMPCTMQAVKEVKEAMLQEDAT